MKKFFSSNYFIALIAFVAGIGLLIYSFYTIRDYNEKNKKYIETESYVVDYYEKDDAKYPIVEYNVDGKTYRNTSHVGSSFPKKIGSKVMIKYNPNNPEQIIWEKDSTNIIVPIFGIVFIICGVLLIIRAKKTN